MRTTLEEMNDYAASLHTRIEKRIPQLIERHAADRLDEVPSSALMRGVISQALASSKGGKRLRALLTIAAGTVAGSPLQSTPSPLGVSAVTDVACAVEIFQTGALVHDDIIDDSDLRRGAPAAHKGLALIFGKFAARLAASHSSQRGTQTASSPSTQPHLPAAAFAGFEIPGIGNGLGIMLGDLLATMSLDVVSHSAHESVIYEPLLSAFLDMQREVEIGQVLDLADTAVRLDDPDVMIENCLSVFRWKTASYTTIAPLRLGFLCAGFSRTLAATWAQRIGTPLGTAFQLADDLIDVQLHHRTSGKPLGGDIKEGKRTVLLADALRSATSKDRATLIATYSQESRGEEAILPVIEIFERSGAIESSRRRIAALWKETREHIEEWGSQVGVTSDQVRRLSDVCALFLPHITTDSADTAGAAEVASTVDNSTDETPDNRTTPETEAE